MDEYERFMVRQRALRRAQRLSGQARDLWGFENWGDGATQEHHPGRRKFSTEVTIIVPTAMHTELTRRGEEEHPPVGPDPGNRLEREGRLHAAGRICTLLYPTPTLDWRRHVCWGHRRHRDINAVHIPKGLLRWMAQIANDLTLAMRAAFDKDEE